MEVTEIQVLVILMDMVLLQTLMIPITHTTVSGTITVLTMASIMASTIHLVDYSIMVLTIIY